MRATWTFAGAPQRRTIAPLLALFATLIPVLPARARDASDYRVRVGLGGQSRPEYISADKNEWAPLVDISVAKGNAMFDFEAPDDNFDIKLFSTGGFSFGPVANVQSGRKNSDVGAPLGKVKTTIEAGLFVQYQLSGALRLRSEVRKGIGGHKGVVASFGADHVWRDGDKYVVSLGPRVLFSNARYQRAWFGIGPESALATGLPGYRPDAGVHAVAMTGGATYAFNRAWGLFGYARYERLVSDAAKSPVVRQFGARNQGSAGLGVTYTFAIKR